MSKFTPGPWELHTSNLERASSHVIAPGGAWPYNIVADVREMFGEFCPAPGTHPANARLIAAAPEMYDLLRAALVAFETTSAGAHKIESLLKRIEG